jgi:hypothetical protein
MRAKHSIFLVLFVLLISLWEAASAAAQKSQMVDLEEHFGKGWQCLAVPNGIAKVGVIFEQRKDKTVFFVADLKEANITTAPVSVPEITTSKQLSLGAAIKLLSVFFPTLSLSHDSDTKIAAVISGADESVGGGAVRADAIAWAQKNTNQFAQGAKVYVVREAILASQVAYSFDSATTTTITAQLDLTAGPQKASSPATPSAPNTTNAPKTQGTPSTNATPSPTQSTPPAKQSSTVSPPNAANQIAQTFDPKITICIHPDWIVIGSALGGTPKPIIVEVTDDLGFK